MHKLYQIALVTLTFLLIKCATNRIENQCLEYYKTDTNFDLNFMIGSWNLIYFWPQSLRKHDKCESVIFRNVTKQEIDNLRSNCNDDEELKVDQLFLQATHESNAGKFTNATYYGNEYKRLFLSCDRIFKYVFIKVNDRMVLGINCSANGRGILFSRTLLSKTEIDDIVGGIEIMSGRDGSINCKLV